MISLHSSFGGWTDSYRGVQVTPLSQDGREVTITYNGLLQNSGAEEVYLHHGFGDNWHSTSEFRMEKTPQGWQKTVVMQDNQVTFCFKDNAQHWDNNEGHNWMYRLSSGF